MKLIWMALSFLLTTSLTWLTDFEQAKQTAKEKNQYILLNFSGSDWCIPCQQMKKEIFESSSFSSYASSNLVLLNADFPRSRKNKLSKTQLAHNEALAEQYNKSGKFPLTVLLNSEGKVLKVWDGLPDGGADQFIRQISTFDHAPN
jgi:thioredoxin-related protein